MKAQEVIKSFMAKLANHGYAYSETVGKDMLDSAVRASSRFFGIQDVIDAMKKDQIAAGDATTFLSKYCGIQLYNTDTGAITGSDAGASTTKTDRSIVPEENFNTYIASTATAQNITTNSKDWIVQATDSNDTITSNSSDSINAGAGDDSITANADGATITSGSGADFITVSQTVSDVTLSDLNSYDTLTISGTFEIGSARIEDTLLVITDKTGKRKIRLGDLDNAKNAKINSTTVGDWLANADINLNNLTVKNYSEGKVSGKASNTESATSGNADEDSGRIVIDPDYTPTPMTAEEKPSVKKGIDYSIGAPHGSSNTANGAISVDLGSVTPVEGNVIIGGATVGAVSSSFPDASTFTRNGLTIHLLGTTSDTSGKTDNITAKTFNQLTDDQKTIVAGLFKWWGKECLALNEESYGISFNSPTAMVKDIGLFFYDSANGVLATVWNWQRVYSDDTGDGAAIQLMLNVNMNYYKDISADDVDGTATVSGAGFLDRTLAHEFNHAVMAANVNYFNTLPKFIKEGFAELTHGIDDERGSNILNIAGNAEQLAASLNLDDTGTGSQAVGDAYSGGYMFLRYFAKQAAAQTESLPAFGEITAAVNLADLNPSLGNILYIDTTQKNPAVQVAADLDTFNNLYDPNNVLFALGEIVDVKGYPCYLVYNDYVKQVITTSENIFLVNGVNSDSTVNGSAGTDYIFLNQGANIINTGAGDDVIDILGQYSTINAGEGNDDISISGGGHHSINLGDGDNIVSIKPKRSFSNTIVGGSGNDTVINADENEQNEHYHEDENIDLGDGENEILLYYAENSTLKTGAGGDIISVRGGENNIVDAGDSADYVEVLGDSHSLNAGEGDDSIQILGSGNTIIGGDGNDSINQHISSTGGNYFVYNSTFGDDTILGFRDNDSILIPDSFSTNMSGSVITISKDDTVKGHIYLNGVTSPVVVAGVVKELIKEDKTMADYTIDGSSSATDFDKSGATSAENYTIDQNASASSIFIGSASGDTITNNKDTFTIAGGSGADKITNNAAGVSISGGSGADTIINNNQATIYGGLGDDSISIGNGADATLQFKAGDGNDTVSGFASNHLQLMEDTTIQSATINGSTLIFGFGDDSGKIQFNSAYMNTVASHILDSSGSAQTLKGIVITLEGNSPDYSNTIEGAKINGSNSGENTITNSGASVSIVASYSSGNVITNNAGGTSATIEGGAGKDTITNAANYVTISAGGGDDSIKNTGTNVLFNYGGGKDTIDGFGANELSIAPTVAMAITDATLNSDGALVLNLGGDSKIQLGSYSLGDNNTFTLTTAKISVNSASATLSKFINEKSAITITGTNAAETINNSGSNVSIGGVSGADVITNSGATVTITTGVDDDTITNTGAGVKIEAAGGSNVINNSVSGANVTITTGADNDSITNSGANVSIFASGGSNTITNESSGTGVTITAGEGADKITNKAINVTISAGAGDDTIENQNATLTGVVFNYGGGTDTISNFGKNTLNLGASGFSAAVLDKDSNLVITVGSGEATAKVSLGGVSFTNNTFSLSSTMITGDSGDTLLNVVENSLASITIAGTNQAEAVTNKAAGVHISLGGGANVITNEQTSGTNVTITTGDDADTITNNANNVKIYSNAGGDSIVNTGATVTIDSGAGADYVSNSGASVLFIYNGGSDTIVGFSASSTLKLGESVSSIVDATIGAADVSLKIGSDIVKLDGASSLVIGGDKNIQSLNLLDKNGTAITLANVAISSALTGVEIKGSSAAETITNHSNSITISAGGGNDVINNTAESGVTFIYGGGNDTIENFSGNSLSIAANSFSAATLDAGKNLILQIGGSSKISLGSFSLADNTFTLSSDKIQSSSDTNVTLNVFSNSASGITISGTDANETITNTATGVKISAGGGSNVITNNKVDGGGGSNVTIETGNGADVITNSANLVTINSGSGADSISNSGGASVVFEYLDNTTGKTTISGFNATSTLKTGSSTTISGATLGKENVTLKFSEDNEVILAGVSALPTSGQIKKGENTFNLTNITVANGATGTIIGTSGDDTITNAASGVIISMGGGSDSIDNSSASATGVTFIYGGGSATIAGFKIANSTLRSSVDSASIGKATLGTDGNLDLTIGNNVMQLKSLVTGSASAFTLDSLSLYNKDATVKSALNDFVIDMANVTVTGTNDNDTIENKKANVTINALGGSNVINNTVESASVVAITTGDGADTISNKNNQVTINAGAGADSIKNDGGSSFVFIYTGGDDTIDGFQVDSTFSLGSASLTISNATIGAADVSLKIGDNTVKLTGTSSIFNAGMSIVNANGSAVALNKFEIASNATGTINGTDGNDVVTNKSREVTISLGAGADSVNNESSSSVTFIYGGGADSIGGFSSSTLIIGDADSAISAATLNGNNINLKISDGNTINLSSVTLGGTSFSLASPFAIYKGEVTDTNKAAITNITINSLPSGIKQIIGGDSAETINNSVSGITIDAGGGSNFITNLAGASKVTITTGKDDDTISNAADEVVIAGGSGANSISNSGASVVFQYSANDGATTIKGFNADDKLQLKSDGLSVAKATLNSDSTVLQIGTVATDLITLEDYSTTKNFPVIVLNNSGTSVMVKDVEISLGTAHTISNEIEGASITGTGSKDTIYNTAKAVSIVGGLDSDSIVSSGESATIDGGGGADVISISGGVSALLLYGAGLDTIIGFDKTSTLELTDFSAETIDGSKVAYGGNGDIVITISDQNKVMLKGAVDSLKYDAFNIVNGSGRKVTFAGLNISGTANAESIGNYFTNATIEAKGGADSITNYSVSGVYIDAGAGDDIIVNAGTSSTAVSIISSAGANSISNDAAKVYISLAGSGKNTIQNTSASATEVSILSSSSGAHLVSNAGGASMLVSLAGGADSIYNMGASATAATIYGGDGNNFVSNEGALAYISLGSGADKVYNTSESATKVTILSSGNGNDLVENKGASAYISLGGGKDTIYNTANAVSILSGAGDDLISVTGASAYIDAGAGKDSIYNDSVGATKVSIFGSGNDSNYVYNVGASASISLGGGGDKVYNFGASYVSIYGGDGANSINNAGGVSAYIELGTGNDTIYSSGDYATINSGTGNDYISISGSSAVFLYDGGKDTISGFANDAKLQLVGYTDTIIAGNLLTVTDKDLQLSLGTDSILTIKNVFTGNVYSTLNIVNDAAATINFDGLKITGTKDKDTLTNYFAKATIDGGADNDIIYNYGASASIVGNAGNDTIVSSLKSGVYINGGDGADSIVSYGASTGTADSGISIVGDAGNDYIFSKYAKEVSLVGGAGNDTIISEDLSAIKATILGGDGDDSIKNEGASSYIELGGGKDTVINNSYSAIAVSIIGTAGDNYVSNNGGASIYISLGTGADYVYNMSASATAATIYGGDGNNTVKNDGEKTYIYLGKGNDSVENAAVKDVTIIDGDGTNYVKNEGASAVISLGGGADTVLNTGASAASASIFGNAGLNSVSNAGASFVYIELGKDNDSVINTGASATIYAGDGANNISNNDGGDFAIISLGSGNDYVVNIGKNATIYAEAGKDTISNKGEAASIFGGAGNDSITNDGAEASIFGDAGTDYIVNKAASAVINGGADKDTIVNQGASATIFGGLGDDSIANESNAANVVFAYSLGGGKDTISGFNDTSTFSLVGGDSNAKYEYSSTVNSNNDVILSIYDKDSVHTVTFTGAGKLEKFGLNGNISLSNVFRLDDTADTEFKVADYKLGDESTGEKVKVISAAARKKPIHITGNQLANSIVGGTGADTLDGGGTSTASEIDSLVGGGGKDVFVFSGGSVIIEDYVSGTDKVSLASSIASGYTNFASIGNGDLRLTYTTGTDAGAKTHNLSITGGYGKAITFNDGDTTDVIRAYQDNAVFNNVTVSATSMTLESGVKDSYDASKYGKVVTINAESVNSAIAISGNTLANYIVAGSISGATINGGTGNDTIVAGGQSDAAKPYVFFYENTSAGTDVIEGYNSKNMSISLGSGIKEITDVTVSDSVATFKFANNSAIVTNFATNTEKSIVNIAGGVSATFSLTSAKQGVFVNNTTVPTAISLPATFDAAYTVAGGVTTVDASKVSKAIYITGSESGTSILGSAGNDTLEGVKGNNKLTGGNGVDFFIYNGDGNDTITDYTATDRIYVKGTDYKDYAFGTGDDSVNLILTYNSGESSATDTTLTLADGRKNNTVTFANGNNSTTYIYNPDAVLDAKQTSATVISSATSFNASTYSALVTIDGTALGQEAGLFGNSKANVIIADDSGATMEGGAGNDTLTGGKGADTFVYAKSTDGIDVIENYDASSSDVISIGSGLSISDVIIKGDDTTFKIGNGGITVNKPVDKNITFVGGVSTTYSIGGGVFIDETVKSVSLPASYGTSYTIPGGISHVDASKSTKAINIVGNDLDNSIIGSSGNDTLSGLKGNDTLYGGAGNDLFIFGGGSDVIADYNKTGADKITIQNLNYKDYYFGTAEAESPNLVLTYTSKDSADNNLYKLQLVGVTASANNTVTFADGNKTTVDVFTDRGIFDVKKTMVTINSGLSSFTATESTLVTIDGTAVTQAAAINGNSNNNYIIAGDSGTTLYGGKGNNTFIAGGGSDVIIYDKNSVNYTIDKYDNSDNDVISLGSGVEITDITVNEKTKDVTFKVDKNSIIVKGVADSLVTFEQYGGQDSVFSDGVVSVGSTSSVTIPASFAESTYSLPAAIWHADASARTKLITINGNEQANSLFGSAGNDTIDGKAGDDSLTGNGGNDLFVFSGGKDVIVDYSTGDKISLGGDSSIKYSDFKLDGKDLVIGYGDNNSLTIKDGDGKEIAFLDGKVTTTYIYNKDGVFDIKKTSVVLASSLPSYNASAESALLTISADAVKQPISITGNNKNNLIIAGAQSATINGKEGNDTFVGGAGNDVFFYDSSLAGSDMISLYGGASSSDAISIGSGLSIDDVTINDKTKDVLIKVGKNTITVRNAANSVGAVPVIQFKGADERAFSIAGGVFVDNTTAPTAISLPATFDKEYTVSGGVSHVDASALTKMIHLKGDTSGNSLFGGDGNDTLEGLTGNDTLKGGKGNDLFIYNGGSDVIVDYSENGTLGADKISVDASLTEGGFSFVGNDLVISYGSANSLTIVDGNKNNSIVFTEGKKSVTKIYDNVGTFDQKKTAVKLAPTTNFNASVTAYSDLLTIDGSAAGAATIIGNDKNNSIVAGGVSAENKGSSLIGGKGNDTLVGTSLGADLFIYDSSLAGSDTIVDFEVAKDKISILSGLEIDDVTTKTAKGSSKKDIIFKLGKGAITVKDLDATLTGTISLTSGAGNDSLYHVASETFMEAGDNGISVTLPATYKEKSYTLSTISGSDKNVTGADASLLKKAIDLIGNNADNTLIGGKGNDTLTGGTGNDYFEGKEGGDVFVFTGGADSIAAYEVKDKINMPDTMKGTYSGYNIVKANDTAKSGDVVLNYGEDNSISIKGGMDQAISFLYGSSKKAEVQYFSEAGVFDSRKTAFSLKSGTGDRTDFAATGTDYAKVITVDGGEVSNAVSIVGSSTKANRIIAGDHGSTLNGGGKSNDTLVGGASVDVFVYENTLSGNDFIESYGEGDKISLGSGLPITDVTKKTVKGKTDVIFKIGKNSLTVKEADINITLTGGVAGTGEVVYNLDDEVLLSSDGKTASIPASYTKGTNSYTIASGYVATVDASERTKPIKLYSTKGETNVLIGGSGNDTIDSKSGSNSLTGGKGNDEFVIGSGANDTIIDYSPKGSLGADKINDSALASYYQGDFTIEGDNVKLQYTNGGSLTIAKGKGEQITFVNSNKKTEVRVYDTAGVYDGKITSMSLAADQTAFTASSTYDKLITINGTKATSAAAITGNAKGNIIIASNNGSTLNGKEGNDTLYGGNGDDKFIYESTLSGNDIIYGYGTGNDEISLGSGVSITDVTTKADGKTNTTDLIVKVGKGTITIKDGAKSESGITFSGAMAGTLSKEGIFTTTTTTKLFPSFKDSVSADTATLDASEVKAGIEITGVGYVIGGNGKDTLSGAGTLWGGKGNDLIDASSVAQVIYHAGEGNDTITGMSFEDSIDKLMLYDKGTSTTKVGITKGTFNKDGSFSLGVVGGGTVVLTDHGITEPSETPYTVSGGEEWYVGQAKNGSLTFSKTPYVAPTTE